MNDDVNNKQATWQINVIVYFLFLYLVLFGFLNSIYYFSLNAKNDLTKFTFVCFAIQNLIFKFVVLIIYSWYECINWLGLLLFLQSTLY